MKSRFMILLIIAMLALSGCVSLAEDLTPPPNSSVATAAPTMAPVFPEAMPSAANGQAIYGEKCAACHGVTGMGDGEKSDQLPNPATALGDRNVSLPASPAWWYTAVTEGNLEAFMPPFTSLTDQERWDVVAYAYSLTISEESITAGKDLYTENCAICHGADGTGQTVDVDLTDQAFMANRSAVDVGIMIVNGSENGMPAFGEDLIDAEITVLTDYVRSFTMDFSGVEAVAVAEPEPTAEPTEEPAEEAAPAETDSEGAALFAENCALCHAPDGSGASVDVDLRDKERMDRFPDEMLFALIGAGNDSGMPAFGDRLTEAQIDTLVAYLRELPAADGQNQAQSESDAADLVGTVSGVVQNGSSGESLPEGLVIQLQGYDHDGMTGMFNEAYFAETTVNADGSYLFEDVEMPVNRAFVAVIETELLSFSSEPGFVTEGMTTLDLPVTFYETSTDTSKLSIDRLHMFFEVQDSTYETIQVVEVFVVTNPTVYAVVAANEGEATIEFDLPEGAMNVSFEDSTFGERYTETATGFGDTAAIAPGIGQHQVIVFFELPYDKDMDFAQSINQPIDSAIVMVPQGIKVKSDLLSDSGEREAQGMIYNVYSSQPLPVGSTLTMNVSGKLSASTAGSSEDTQQNLLFGAIAFGVVLIGAGAWLFMRNRNEDDEYDDDDDEEDDDDDEADYQDAESIMDAIIALDDAYRDGQINKDVYEKRRAELKTQLKDLV